jgi:hypothetical protein
LKYENSKSQTSNLKRYIDKPDGSALAVAEKKYLAQRRRGAEKKRKENAETIPMNRDSSGRAVLP